MDNWVVVLLIIVAVVIFLISAGFLLNQWQHRDAGNVKLNSFSTTLEANTKITPLTMDPALFMLINLISGTDKTILTDSDGNVFSTSDSVSAQASGDWTATRLELSKHDSKYPRVQKSLEYDGIVLQELKEVAVSTTTNTTMVLVSDIIDKTEPVVTNWIEQQYTKDFENAVRNMIADEITKLLIVEFGQDNRIDINKYIPWVDDIRAGMVLQSLEKFLQEFKNYPVVVAKLEELVSEYEKNKAEINRLLDILEKDVKTGSEKLVEFLKTKVEEFQLQELKRLNALIQADLVKYQVLIDKMLNAGLIFAENHVLTIVDDNYVLVSIPANVKYVNLDDLAKTTDLPPMVSIKFKKK